MLGPAKSNSREFHTFNEHWLSRCYAVILRNRNSKVQKLLSFLRSVTPEDPWQLVFLVGVVLIFVCPRAPWLPTTLLSHLDLPYGDLEVKNRLSELRVLTMIFLYPIIFAGLAGYFSCFWPGPKPLRRLLWSICLPVIVSLCCVLRLFFELGRQTSSVLHFKSDYGAFPRWLRQDAVWLPSGQVLCAIGLALVVIFAIRLAMGRSTLPLRLSTQSADGVFDDKWSNETILVFVLVGPYFLMAGLIETVIIGLPFLFLHGNTAVLGRLGVVAAFFDGVLLIATAVFVLGRPAALKLKAFLRLPDPQDLAVALALPAAITYAVPTAQYVLDRVEWASQFYGRYSPPQLAQYLGFSNIWHLVVLTSVLAAVAEEVVFRGFLLTPFIERYGLQRGILLVGVIWAAIHFRSDSYTRLSVGEILLHLTYRIVFCLALNYVLSWMTLRQRSILSAIVVHVTWNLFNTIPMEWSLPYGMEIRLALLAIVAYILFWRWPVTEEMPQPTALDESSPEPAV